MPRATVVCPTYVHGELLYRSVGSALDQTVQDLEILVIGDGMTEPTREAVAALDVQDERIRVFDFPKGPRRGEAYRHQVLLEHARGRIVCYLGDDDLWLPDHVETLEGLLEGADFAHAPPVMIYGNGAVRVWPVDLANPDHRRRVFARGGFFPLSSQAHTMDCYRRLPYGWRTTPEGVGTDCYMAQQFIAQPDCRLVSGTRPTYVGFPAGERMGWTPEMRAAELDEWRARLADPAGRADFYVAVFEELRARLLSIESSRTWQLRNRLRRVPLMVR
jgi:glycosyltransferase involved in cell wall biosynthesis